MDKTLNKKLVAWTMSNSSTVHMYTYKEFFDKIKGFVLADKVP